MLRFLFTQDFVAYLLLCLIAYAVFGNGGIVAVVILLLLVAT